VVRRARALLAQLEQRAAGVQPQLDLFAGGAGALGTAEPSPVLEPPADALREKLAAIDIDSLSPRQALALLYELKALGAR
jgi:DNA mismatch repair protein MutS